MAVQATHEARQPLMIDHLIEKMLSGDRKALARLLSLIERDSSTIPAVMKAVSPHTGNAYRVGVTGPPGAGKSTMVDGLVRLLRDEGSSVGVLAVDPTSPLRGGAVLGDRVRMGSHSLDPGVFIRSVATRGAHGGLSRVARAAVRLLDAFGEDVVVLESVGVGQTELEIMHAADTVIVTLVPEAGDAVQVLKAGLMEIGDVFVVNKADREGAGRLASAVKVEVNARESDGWWTPPILLTQAHKGEGLGKLRQAIAEHRSAGEGTGNLDRRRVERRREEFTGAVRDSIEARLSELETEGASYRHLLAQVERDEIDPYSAAAEAMKDGTLIPGLAKDATDDGPPA